MFTKDALIMALPFWFLLFTFAFGLFFVFPFIYKKKGGARKDVTDRYHKSFFTPYIREYIYSVLDPWVKLFLKLKFTPNMITSLSLVLSLGAAYLFFRGWFSWAGFVLMCGSMLDAVDGQIARKTGLASKEGAFYDSCIDRFNESFVLLALALYYQQNTIMLAACIIAIIGSTMVSYTKARGEAVGATTKRGLMQRPERAGLLCFMSIIQPPTGYFFASHNLSDEWIMYFTIGVIAIFTMTSAFSRMISIFKTLRSEKQN